MNGYSTKQKTTMDGTTPLKRTRAKRSCDFCRKRKARCDADHTIPCSNCKAWGFNCEFLTVRKKRGPPSVYVENLETRCKKMESLLTSLTNTSIKDIERNDFRAESYLNNSLMKNNTIQQHYRHSTNYNQNDDNDDNSSLEEEEEEEEEEEDDDSEYSIHQNNSNAVATMDEALANLNIDDYDSIKYTGHSAGLQLLDEKLFKSKAYVSLPGREDVALQLMSQNELLVVRAGKKTDTRLDVGFSLTSTIFDENNHLVSSDSLNSKSIDKVLPTNTFIDKAIKLYFSHIHTFLPIVNRTRFETHDMKSSSNVLVQAVLAVSFRFASRHFPKLFNKKVSLYADIYFRKVMSSLQKSYRARLRDVQAALLMTLYLDMDDNNEHIESMQWYTLGKAIRMAQDIGLHRSCSNWNLPRSEIETRHRVFYACYILDRLMGARAGKPLTILDRDFDTDLPVPYEVYDNNEEQGPSIYHSFISLIKLCEILGRILKALYAPKSKHSNSNAGLDDPTILAVFDRRLKNWKASLDQSPDGIKVSQAQKVNLLLFYYTVMLLLHRPFIEFSSLNQNNNYESNAIQGSLDLDALAAESRQACENAASNISVIVRQKQSLMSDPDSYSPLCLPTCFVYSMFQSSLIHLAIAIKNRDSLRRLRLLQRSIGLLKQHQMLSSGQRAHNILIMLVAINGINIDNLLENDNSKEEDNTIPNLSDDGIFQSPLLKNRKELQFSVTRPTIPLQQQQQQQIPSHEQQIHSINNTTAMIPSCEDSMPKSSWYQRMMNTSIVGGITPDLHQGITDNNSSSQTLEQLLPYSHTMTGPPHHHHGHSRSDSNATLYHQPDTEIQGQSTYCNSTNYYDLNQPTNATTTKRMDIYNDRQQHDNTRLFEEAGGNMRMLQGDPNSYHHAPTTAATTATNATTTLLSHQHNTSFTQRNNPGLPFAITTAPGSYVQHNANGSPIVTNNYPTVNNYLPPSSLNWSDWGVYIPPPATNGTTSEHHHQLHTTR